MKKIFNKKNSPKKEQEPKQESLPVREELKLKRKLVLPKEFAKKVIALENQCDHPEVTMKQVKDLMDLYTAAIEYYNSRSDNDSQRFYQNKLHILITKIDAQFLQQQPGQKITSNSKPMTAQEQRVRIFEQWIQERQIEKKRVQDAIELGIYNQTKNNEEVKEKLLDEMIRNEEESIKIFQNDLLNQKQNFLKKLAEKKKAKERSQSLNTSLNLNFNLKGDQQYNQNKPQHALSKVPSSSNLGPMFGISRIGNKDQSYISSGNKSVYSANASLANIVTMAFSREPGTYEQNDVDDEDIDDLIYLVSELNQNEDLNVKLNNHSKICKILENNDEPDNPAAARTRPIRNNIFDSQFKEIMDNCKKQLQEILDEREKAIEEFLENYAEEKFKETQEIKKKYQTTLNFLQKSKKENKEEKIKAEEEKQAQEIQTLQDELAKKKKEGLDQIKLKFNQMSKKVQIDSKLLEQTLRQKITQNKAQEQRPIHQGAVESPVREENQKYEQFLTENFGTNGQPPKQKRKESQGYIGNLRSNQNNPQ